VRQFERVVDFNFEVRRATSRLKRVYVRLMPKRMNIFRIGMPCVLFYVSLPTTPKIGISNEFSSDADGIYRTHGSAALIW
jgi:hypothetical protein